MSLQGTIISIVERKIYECVPQIIRRTGRLNFKCPLCGDSKKNGSQRRGWFFLDDGVYKCYNDGCTGDSGLGAVSFYALLSRIDYKQAKKEILMQLKDSGDSLQGFLNENSLKQKMEEKKPITFYDIHPEWYPIEENKIAYDFIKNRKIMEAPFFPESMKLYYDKKQDKIVIPWWRDGKMVCYQYRTLKKDDPRKYTFPFNSMKDIFGMDNIDSSYPYIFYTEGAFDAIFFKNCIAIGGLSPNEKQMKLLKEYAFIDKELVFLPDNPWVDESARKNIMKLKLTHPSKKIFMWEKSNPYKDFNEEIQETGDLLKYTNTDYINSRVITILKASVILQAGINF